MGRPALGARRRRTGPVGDNRGGAEAAVLPVIALLAALLAAPPAAPVAAGPRFVDRAATLPVAHVYSGGWEHFVGGGVAAFDCDEDGRPELFAAGGAEPARLFLNRSAPGAPAFAPGAIPEMTGVTGAYPLDVDGDGALDLAVLRVGPNRLLRGLGGCRFEEAPAAWGFDDGGDSWTTAFAATWERGRDWPTLVFGNYVDRADPAGPFEACDANLLLRPEGRRWTAPVRLEPGWCALSMLISDWRRTGEPELRISNDRHYYVRGGYEEMWRLNPLAPRTEADGWPRLSLWGMGVASRDLTGDGLPEVFLTSMGDQVLQFNDGERFRNAPYAVGTYAQRPHVGDDGRPSTGWHAEFGDVDNDGLADLFIAKGNVDQMPSNAMRDPNNLLMQRADGTFAEASAAAGLASTARSRGAALADLDGDGRLDVAVVNRRAPMELWLNATPGAGGFVAVEPRQPGPNGRAVGAWVELRAEGRRQTQEIVVGGGHAGGRAGPLHFGIGEAASAEVRVIWPDGAASDWAPLAPGARVALWRDGAAIAVRPLH